MNTNRRLVAGAMLAGLITVSTAWIKVPIPRGYVHAGDGLIFAASALLGPYGALPAALGSALADLYAGYGIYMLPTFIIKGGMGLMAAWGLKKQGAMRRLAAFIAAELLMMLGYLLTETLLFGWQPAMANLPFNGIQAVFGLTLGYLLLWLLRRIRSGIS